MRTRLFRVTALAVLTLVAAGAATRSQVDGGKPAGDRKSVV